MLKEATAANDADRMSMENYAQLRAIRDARRRNNKVRRLHHHAVRTDDMEATRRFYEDLLGMPMVAAMRGLTDRHLGGGTPFLHCFFELGDGSSLAFFQFAPETSGPADKLPPDGIDHHGVGSRIRRDCAFEKQIRRARLSELRDRSRFLLFALCARPERDAARACRRRGKRVGVDGSRCRDSA
jgi:catechol 2,3-dioxygenase-like lactoylglutathione lyase family enzyme